MLNFGVVSFLFPKLYDEPIANFCPSQRKKLCSARMARQRMERQKARKLLRRRIRYWLFGIGNNRRTEHGMTDYMPACTHKCIEYLTNFAYGLSYVITASWTAFLSSSPETLSGIVK